MPAINTNRVFYYSMSVLACTPACVLAVMRAATRTMPLVSPDVSPRSTAGVLGDGHRSSRHVMSVCDWQPVEYIAMCYALASICNSPLEYLRDIVDSAAIVL